MNLFENSRFVWIADEASRNTFAVFERTFDLSEVPKVASLHLFADTRYRLWVNDHFAYAGPGRFVTQFPEYDSVDLAPYLRSGPNTIRVEVNFFGASSFQSMPDGKPGFIAAGDLGNEDLGTPGAWVGSSTSAWREDAPLFSFAQSPVEICDTRRLLESKQTRLRLLTSGDAPWGRLEPSSGTPLPFSASYPKLIEVAGRLETTERRIGFMLHDPSANRPEAIEGRTKPAVAFATWVHSEFDQSQVWSCYWSSLWLNGQPVKPNYESRLGNHGTVELELRRGWNLLTGVVEVLTEYWAYCLGVPLDSGVSLHAGRDSSVKETIAVGPVGSKAETKPLAADCTTPPDGWTKLTGDPDLLTPARMMAWDVPAPDGVRGTAFEHLDEVSTLIVASATWIFSFEAEFLGHIVIEVDGPAGAVLDVACDDWQREDGLVALYKSNPFVDSADRFVLVGGPQRIELFHARGGKFVQVTMRVPTGLAPAELTVKNLWVRSRQIWSIDPPAFASDNEVLDWTWTTSLRTLAASTDDAYSDCPWRERGSYIGDSLVSLHLTFLSTTDLRTARRTLVNFGRGQLPNGQLACCSPAWLRKPHEDFTLIWILAVRDYWANTGDVEFLQEVWEFIERIWESPSWESHESGLWNLENRRAFIDWGVLQTEREGVANAAINALRVGAAQATAEVAEILGHTEWATRLESDAKSTSEQLINILWDEEEGRLFPALGAITAGLHANVWALAFGVGSIEERLRILTYLEPFLMKNVELGLENGQFDGHSELYFLAYLLPTLAEMGRPDLAEYLIGTHYGYLKGLGDDTLPECFCRVEAGNGSRCYSWSGAAAIYAARYVLGIRLAEEGNPNAFIFDPMVSEITRAKGSIPHRAGLIKVAWELEDGRIVSNIECPESVTVLQP